MTNSLTIQSLKRSGWPILAAAASVSVLGAICAGSPLIGFAVAILLGLLLIWIAKPELPLLLAIAVLPFGSYLALPHLRPMYPVIAFAIAVAVAGLLLRRTPEIKIPWLPFDAPLLALTLFVGLSCSWSLDREQGVILIAQFCVNLALCVLPRFFLPTRSLVRKAVYFWLVCGSIAAILSAFVGASAKQAERSALFDTPNIFSAYLNTCLFLAAGLFMSSKGSWKRLAVVVWMLPICVAFALTQSRGGYVSFGAAAVFLVAVWPELRHYILDHLIVVVLIVVLAATALVSSDAGRQVLDRVATLSSPGETEGMQIRYVMWRVALRQFTRSHCFGTGAGALRQELTQDTARSIHQGPYRGETRGYYLPHSLFMQILAELGVIGVVIVLWLAWRLAACFRYQIARNTDPMCRSLLYGAYGALVAVGVHALVDLDPSIRLPWIVIGMVGAIMACSVRRSEPVYRNS